MHQLHVAGRHWTGHLALPLFLLLAACHGDPAPGPPQQVLPGIGNRQETSVGTAVLIPPSVKVQDSRGTGIPGRVVRFSVGSGGGHLTGDSAMTDANGTAQVGSWILGTLPGANTLLATVDSTTITGLVTATAVAGPPAAVRVVGSPLYTAEVGQPVAPAPKVLVLDSYLNPVSGVVVTFSVLSGGGILVGAAATTNSVGQAQLGSWTLGTAPGVNQLVATVAPGVSITFTATGFSGSPLLSSPTPTEQSGFLSFPVTATPRVLVADHFGNPLANVAVIFTMTEGDGSVTNATVATGADGRAALGDWRMGPSGGSSTVVASLPDYAGPTLTFHATGVATPFIIDVRFLTAMSSDSRDAFVAAARRWMQIIVGDVPDQFLSLQAGACATGQPAINETIDDLVIFASVVAIDGPGNVLGSAGPCVVRSGGAKQTLVGTMRFDEADLALLQSTNRIVPTIEHEMGHVLGFGTEFARGTTQDIGLADPIYVGNGALSLWPSFTLSQTYAGRPIPLENTGGAGTRDSHWRESVFHAELMTGTIEYPGVPMPISKLTIGVMQDLGYQVNFGASDSFAGNLIAAPFASLGSPIPLKEDIHRAQFEVMPGGGVRRIQ